MDHILGGEDLHYWRGANTGSILGPRETLLVSDSRAEKPGQSAETKGDVKRESNGMEL